MVVSARINPAVLVWAREQAGLELDQAAKRIGTSPSRLAAWEKGASFPTPRLLRLAGKAYRRPSAFFYLPKPPTPPPALPDFRTVSRINVGTSPTLLYQIRRARFRRQTAIDLAAELGEIPPQFGLTARPDAPAPRVARAVREASGIDLTTQFSWRDPYEALRAWIEVFENLGVLVSQFSGVDVSETRGFALPARPWPVICLNAEDAPRGRIFTLVHEVVHLALNQGGLCDLHEDAVSGRDLEPFCNQVAGEFLVPSAALMREEAVVAHPAPEWPDQTLSNLADRFMVSREVVLRRLLGLERTTRTFYELARKRYLKEYPKRRPRGFLRHHRKVLRENGVRYTSLVITAFRNDTISARDLCRYLGDVKLRYVDSIAHDLGFP